MEIPSELTGDMDLNGLELGPDIVDAGMEQNVWSCETDVSIDPNLIPLGPDTTSDKTSCSCLASIYLCLEETRAAQTTPFSSGIARLRSVTSKASSIIQCPICPTQFVWAMQNSQLLNTLLVSIAEGFRRLARSIDEEALRAENNNETKTLFISETQPGISDLQTGGVNSATPGLPVTLAPKQWASFAKGVVKQEIFGPGGSSTLPFATLLQLMEDRQLSWHSGALPSACASQLEKHSCDSQSREPICVMLVRHTKGIIDQIDFDP